jgi:glycosyltransferase involved in cell wall biosynthesis
MTRDTYSLTVVVGTFRNFRNKLKLTVESVLKQGLTNVKIVVINDNSPEDADFITDIESYLTELNEPSVKYVKNDLNVGVPYVFNKWIQLVETKYFMLIGEGDIILDSSLSRMMEFLESNSIASMVYGLEIDVYDKPQVSNMREGLHDAKQFLDYRFIKNSPDFLWSQSSAMYRTDLFNYFKVRVIVDWYWDFYFHCKYILHSKEIGFINHHIAKRYLDSDQAANLGVYDNLRGNIERINTALKFIDEHEFYLLYNKFPLNLYRYTLALKLLKQAIKLQGNNQASMVLAGNSMRILGTLFFNSVLYVLTSPVRLIFGNKNS